MSGPVGSVSSAELLAADTGSACDRREEAEPTRLLPIADPVLRAAFMKAHKAWAERRAPHLLEGWLDG